MTLALDEIPAQSPLCVYPGHIPHAISPLFRAKLRFKRKWQLDLRNTWNVLAGCSENPSGTFPPLTKNWGCPVKIEIQHQVLYHGNLTDFGNGLVDGLEISSGASLTVNGDFMLPSRVGQTDAEASRLIEKAPKGIVIIEVVWKDKVNHLKLLKN